MDFRIGIDAGSTTVKLLVLNEKNDIVYKSYKRHYSKIREVILEEFGNIKDIVKENNISLAITGSAGYGISKETDIVFVQEVFASTLGIKRTIKDVDVAIELGGEDAKIIFLSDGFEERMNSSCAGGTGAFIDQMAHLMNITNQELDDLSLEHTMIYPIASRCGVFAKSDVQPLLNQGAKKSDISASIFQSVVDQTVGGLAQGREIKGKVLFLGGPLYFYKGLRERFRKTLKLDETTGVLPENAEVFVALGAAIYSQEDKKRYSFNEIVNLISDKSRLIKNTHILPSLFENEEEYKKFKERHAKAKVEFKDINEYEGDVYLGIDAGSTTTKVVLINDKKDIIYTYYSSNKGNPVKVIEEQLKVIYNLCGDNKKIKSSTVTGYGEELIKSAFGIDFGIVETMAHFKAGKHFNPKVDFILDIGGQDIKCFNIKNGIISNIMLNEACSSGCGSFIESFAGQMGYDVKDFAKMALFAKNVVDLGSKCTVFMNSSVKQAQKDGASIEDISAGLSISVVKNALYKVIRIRDAKELGENVLVQGGTMYNDAILRSFEMELGRNVVRPNISGLMGAYGAALYAMERSKGESNIISKEKLDSFTHTSKTVRCGLCGNKCNMTVNIFQDNKRFLSGNRCKKPEGKKHINEVMSLYDYKYKKIRKLQGNEGSRGKIGIPLVLNMYEMLPFWYSFFNSLEIEVVITDASSRKLYRKGQHTIPSDTVCYPAKISHGHIENLLEKGVQTIFYPCMSYNVEEKLADNCFNCPVVAYYPELLKGNIKALNNPDIKFMMPYLTVNNSKVLAKALLSEFKDMFGGISKKEIKVALEKAYKDYDEYKEDIKNQGKKYIQYARENDKKIIVLAGRPYHIDPEINHGIDRAMCELGTVVVSEDCIANMDNRPELSILNQWTYQARLYSAADVIGNEDDMYLIQLVSFGCGTDAITTDEVRDIIERKNKIYTQIKIDETSNLGAAKIRIRSLLETLDTDKGGVN